MLYISLLMHRAQAINCYLIDLIIHRPFISFVAFAQHNVIFIKKRNYSVIYCASI